MANEPLTVPDGYSLKPNTRRGFEASRPQMSVILKFPTNPSRRSGEPIAPGERRGEILFYTGVRIERHVEDAVPPRRGDDRAAKAGRRRKA